MFSKTYDHIVACTIDIFVDERAWWIMIKSEFRVTVLIRDKLAKCVPRFDP